MQGRQIPEADERDQIRSWILLALVTTAYTSSAVDRNIISLLVEPIKADLRISDTKIGLLQGFAFLFIYAVAGIPLGFLVDRARRTALVGGGVLVWSIMTSLCGLASSYLGLFLGRVGVGVGEATLTPAAYSLIGDSFSKRRQGLALGLYTGGSCIGTALSLLVGGYVIERLSRHGHTVLPIMGAVAPWQMAFILLGVAGLPLAVLLAIFPEPIRRPDRPTGAEGHAQRSNYRSFAAQNWRLLILHHMAVGLSQVVMVGSMSWIGAFFMRVHGWDVRSVGAAAGLVVAVGGLGGLLGGGAASDYLVRFGAHMRLLACAVAAVIGAVAGLVFALTPSPVLAIFSFGVVIACAGMPFAAANAALQQVTPGSIRGAVSSVYFFILSVVGAVGPLAVGMLSDQGPVGAPGIRMALATVVPCAFLVSAVLYSLAVGPYRTVVGEIPASPARSMSAATAGARRELSTRERGQPHSARTP